MRERAFAYGHGAGADWRGAVDAAMTGLSHAPDDANLGFVYATDGLAADFPKIVEACRAATGVSRWIGTAGIGICATGQEYYGEPAIVAMLGAFPDDAFELFSTRRARPDERPGADGVSSSSTDSGFGVLHGDPRDPKLLGCIPAIAEAAGGWLVGGLTSSRGGYPQVAGNVEEGGLSGAMFDRRVPILTGIAQGCEPIGPVHRITACDGHIVLTLDDRPAYEVFCEEAGELIARDPRRAGGYIFAGLPIEGTDRNDYLVRNLLGVDPRHGAVGVAAPIETGQGLMFCRRDATSARSDLSRMLGDVRRRLGNRKPRGGLYFSCVARGAQLFGPDSAELMAIRNAIGPVPLVGFFGNGEIARDQLYAYTGVLTLFL